MSHRPSIKKIRANSNALGLTAILAVGLVIQVVRFVRLGPQLEPFRHPPGLMPAVQPRLRPRGICW
jgi:hypothetical protein